MKFATNNKKIKIFKIGNKFCFKQFFNDKEIFNELSDYYNDKKFRFEYDSTNGVEKLTKQLFSAGFETSFIEDFNEYLVKIDRYKKYGSILKNSIEYTELGGNRIFLMKDMMSVELAIEQGAEKYTDEIDVERLIL